MFLNVKMHHFGRINLWKPRFRFKVWTVFFNSLVLVVSWVSVFSMMVISMMWSMTMVVMMALLLAVPAHVAGHHHGLTVLPVDLTAQAGPEVCRGMINQSCGWLLPTGWERRVIMNVGSFLLLGKVTYQPYYLSLTKGLYRRAELGIYYDGPWFTLMSRM